MVRKLQKPVYHEGCDIRAYIGLCLGQAAPSPVPVRDFIPDPYGEGRCMFPAPKDIRSKGKDVKAKRKIKRESDYEYGMRAARFLKTSYLRRKVSLVLD